jgi:hypothetical protein
MWRATPAEITSSAATETNKAIMSQRMGQKGGFALFPTGLYPVYACKNNRFPSHFHAFRKRGSFGRSVGVRTANRFAKDIRHGDGKSR